MMSSKLPDSMAEVNLVMEKDRTTFRNGAESIGTHIGTQIDTQRKSGLVRLSQADRTRH